jgi:hypothetical protein
MAWDSDFRADNQGQQYTPYNTDPVNFDVIPNETTTHIDHMQPWKHVRYAGADTV